MKWITREKAKVDRIACPWLIQKFVDPKAEFIFVPQNEVLLKAKELNAIPFDIGNVELTHFTKNNQEYVSFDAILAKYHIEDPAVLELAKIVRGADADIPNPPPESAGLLAAATGFREIAHNDHENLQKQFPVYDALYAFCQIKIKNSKKIKK
jgi:hypothetical protein